MASSGKGILETTEADETEAVLPLVKAQFVMSLFDTDN